MSEQEKMDRLLRNMMASEPQPALSPAFDRQLMKQLRKRRLNAKGRLLMAVYALFALAISIGVMRFQAIDWRVIAIAVLAPVILMAAVQLRQRTPI